MCAYAESSAEMEPLEGAKLLYKSHRLPKSNATITIPERHYVLSDQERDQFLKEYSKEVIETTETVITFEPGGIIYFQDAKDGYIPYKAKKPIHLDNNRILSSAKRNIGMLCKQCQVLGWLEEPVFDDKNKIIKGTVELFEDGKSFIYSTAIKLGRFGYTRFTLLSEKENYLAAIKEFNSIVNSHNFDIGYRYEDYNIGDFRAVRNFLHIVYSLMGVDAKKDWRPLIIKHVALMLSILLGIVFSLKHRTKSRNLTKRVPSCKSFHG